MTPPPLIADNQTIAAESLAKRLGKVVWRYTFSLPATENNPVGSYAIGDRSWQVALPVGPHLRIAFTACNGRESDRPGDDSPERNAMWRHLLQKHMEEPFQLMLQGGDQLYADYVWEAVPALTEWRRQGRPPEATLTAEAVAVIEDYYFELYCWLWGQAELTQIQATIPSLMMWDDHDIFDGWGSYPANLQKSQPFDAVGTAARNQFALFQMAIRPDQLPDQLPAGIGDDSGIHFGTVFNLGELGIIIPDLRSERTQQQVMGPAGQRWFANALAQLADCRHILLVSTVPLINVDLSPIERLVSLVPGDSLFQTDLRDQWRSYAHRQEWLRLIKQLFDFSEQTKTQLTILSGEIHLGALGQMTRGKTILYQLTASGIVHPPPPRLFARCLDLCSRMQRTVDTETKHQMLPLPGYGRRYLTARNWLALECDLSHSLKAKWYAEHLDDNMELLIPGP